MPILEGQIKTPEELLIAQRAAEARMKEFSSDQIKLLRINAKHNLWFLAYSILGYTKVDSVLHKHLCSWLQRTDGVQFREVLLPRSHYKSTIVTQSDSVRIALPDDLGTSPYPRNLGPNVRVLISHETADAASIFLNSITDHFTSNALLMGLFPECVPNPRTQRINKNELELPRESIWNEPTYDTMGVGGKKQGRHYNYLKLDDLYGAAARDSKAERTATITWFDNVQSFLITPRTDKFDIAGTRWKFDDVYDHAHRMYGDKLYKYIRSCIEIDPETKKQVLIFPEEFTFESIEVLRKNPMIWNAQYANNPKEGGTLFQPEWKRFFYWTNRDTITFDSGLEKIQRNVKELDRIIMIDPAMSGPAGFIVTGMDRQNRIAVLEATKKEWKPPELVDYLFQAVIKWQPRLVAIEEVLFSGLFQHWLGTEMKVRGISFKVVPVRTRQKQKEARVLGLSNYFQAAQIYFNEGQSDLLEEYDQFGATDNYHMLDAMAYGPELWRAPVMHDIQNKMNHAMEMLREAQDAMTGYSSY